MSKRTKKAMTKKERLQLRDECLDTIIESHGLKWACIKRKNGAVVLTPVAMFVAQTFVPNPNGYKFVYHIDGDRTRDHADNLAWSETMKDPFLRTDKTLVL